MKNKIIIFALVILTLVSCAEKVNIPINESLYVYGFWSGVLHGAIMWFSLMGSLIYDDVSIYAINNNGFWYDFGYCGGLGLIIKFVSGFLKSLKK